MERLTTVAIMHLQWCNTWGRVIFVLGKSCQVGCNIRNRLLLMKKLIYKLS